MSSAIKATGMVLVMVVSLASVALAGDICEEQVPTREGPVMGAAEPDARVCVYKGIPYAAPPVGDLRWRAPAPAPQRTSTLEALSFGSICAQKGEDNSREDCLYLNIWRPMKSGTFPVMVWIHGGGLTMGSGSGSMTRGNRLADEKDVVVVTINYRLGPFGFLSHREFADEDPNASAGNYGLLDQVEAFKWVQANIDNFGGDRNNVTIFGESAGGWSVCNLLACPLAKGLFHRAIIQSGGCDATKTVEEGYEDGDEFAAKLGCAGPGAAACLRGKSVDEVHKFMTGNIEGFMKEGMVKFSYLPHEDGHALNETPIEALRSGRFNNVPVMVGTNRDEVKLFTMMIPGIRLAPSPLVSAFVKSALGDDALSYVRREYPYRSYRRPADAATDAFGDMTLGCKCYDAAEAVSQHQPATYYYRFDYDDSRAPHYVGAAHAVEIAFIFDTLDCERLKSLYKKRHLERAGPMADIMMGYWTNFAATGNPNGGGLPDWPAYNIDTRERVYLDLPTQSMTTDNVEKCAFWSEYDFKLK